MPRHDESWTTPNTTVREVVRKLRHLRMTAEPRTKYQYCNMMYITIAHFIETYTGNWLGDIFRKRIWKPLGMNSTFSSLSDAEAATYTGKASLARGYLWLNRTQNYRSLSYIDKEAVYGAGGMISNVLDYAKWLRCMMTMAAPLSQAAHDSLRFPRINLPFLPPYTAGYRGAHGYSLGWHTSNYRGEVTIWHPGGLPGFATMMAYLPRKQWGFAIMANNLERGSIAHQILSHRLLDDLLGIPESERLPWGADMERALQQATETLKNPTKHLYPDAPLGDNAVPLTLSLSHYAGVRPFTHPQRTPWWKLTCHQTYSHPAYLNYTLVTKPNLNPSPSTGVGSPQEILHTDSYTLNGLMLIDFAHVSGENFVIYTRPYEEPRQPGDYEPMLDSVSKAEFRLGEDGKVKELGLLLEEEMGDDKIWFTKVE